ncbi:hypothetical protein PH210_06175 [Paenibacillus sp. BSR1-1]|uniref:hypothetical protein n=1 Tax=Paenibacillus sp. BSR1-1 TaxID=3020845 RepID=UPI0025B03D8A|nr:hypothetical protein [Paenibacillus sp. BSR1-1]MDN3015792.1 hypothetical protein [Paenibacillus sp. BSR1-1]
MSPKFGFRDLTDKVKRLVESVKQVYRHITESFLNEYDPFDTKLDFLIEKIFGAVILYEQYFKKNHHDKSCRRAED